MNFWKYIILCYIILLSSFLSISQIDNCNYIGDTKIYSADSNKLFLQIDNNNFIKNNEYTSSVIEGFTLLGFNIAPKFIYYPSTRIKLSLGGNFLTYNARENEIEASLLFSFQYKISPKFNFVLGNIYGTVNHRLIDPLFDSERFLNKNIENGLQLIWNSDRIFTDLWLDWERQIFQDDPFHEKFNVGLSSEFLIINKENRYKLSIPFQNLVRHEGGQIDKYKEPIVTIFNNATGLSFTKLFNDKFIHKLKISSFVVNYQDLSPLKERMYIDGTSSYSNLELINSNYNLTLGYWYGNQHIAPLGNPIYETYSRTKYYVEEPIRQLIISKLNYQKNVFKGINFGLRFDTYYDLLDSNLDYSWTVMVVFNQRFFLKDFNLK
ncbi:MAG: hypothetical protein PF485_10345 [Bacteroidales bacterium]|jgi:hypothetical protein|nr:hypothetical protein [Bacteroidales bacterium]